MLHGERLFFILFSYNNNDNDNDDDNDNLLKSNQLHFSFNRNNTQTAVCFVMFVTAVCVLQLIPYDSQGTPPLEPCAATRILCRFFEVERLDLRYQPCGSIKDEEICSQMTISANDWNN